MLVNKPIAVTTSYQQPFIHKGVYDKKEVLTVSDGAKRQMNAYSENNIGRTLRRTFHRDKEVPGILSRVRAADSRLKSESEIYGPALGRELVYRPKKPTLPPWITAGESFTMELEFGRKHPNRPQSSRSCFSRESNELPRGWNLVMYPPNGFPRV